MTAKPIDRQQEIRDVHKKYNWFYAFMLGLAILVAGFILGATWFQGDDHGLGYITNFYTEILGIIMTIVILDRIYEYRETQRLVKYPPFEDKCLR